MNISLFFQKMMEELEDEVAEMRAIALRSGADKLKLIESEKTKCLADLKKAQDELASAQTEISKCPVKYFRKSLVFHNPLCHSRNSENKKCRHIHTNN